METGAFGRIGPSGLIRKPCILALLIVVLCMAVSLALFPQSFETVEDAGIMGYVSGARTGEPEADTVFSLILWGRLQAGLYRLEPGVPWYALFFLILTGLAQWLLFTALLELTERAHKPLWSGVLLCVICYTLLFLYYTVRLQYAVVSACCGMGALTLMFTRCREGNGKALLPREVGILILALFSVNICARVGVLLLMSACAVWEIELVEMLISGFSAKHKRIVRNTLVSFLVIAAAVGISLAADRIHTGSNRDWKEFRAYQTQRAAFADHAGESYADNEDMFRSVGWEEETCDLIGQGCFIHEAASEEAFRKIDAYASEEGTAAQNTVSAWFDGFDRGGMIVLQAGVFFEILILFGILCVDWRKKGAVRAILYPAVWFLVFLAETLYFAGEGKVDQWMLEASLLLTAIPSLLIIGAHMEGRRKAGPAGEAEHGRGRKADIVFMACAAAVLIMSLVLPGTPFRLTSGQRSAVRQDLRIRAAMEEYAMEHPDKLFISDNTLPAGGSPWTVYPDRQPVNLLYWGDPGCNSPLYKKQLEENGLYSLGSGDYAKPWLRFMGRKAANPVLSRYMTARSSGAVGQSIDTGEGFCVYRYCDLPVPALRIEPTDTNTVRLSWDQVEGADVYRIYSRLEGEEKWTGRGETAELSIEIRAVPGETYRYRVRACIGEIGGAFDEMGTPYTHLEAPELKVEYAGENRAVLTWNALDWAENYRIYSRREGEEKWMGRGTVTGTSYTDTKVAPGETYYYRIRASFGDVGGAYDPEGVRYTHESPQD